MGNYFKLNLHLKFFPIWLMMRHISNDDQILYFCPRTCLNCSSKVHDPPSSLLPVDCGVGGCDGRWLVFDGWKLGKLIGDPWPIPARNGFWAPAWRLRASKAGSPCKEFRSLRPSLGMGCMGSKSDLIPIIGIFWSSCSVSDWSSHTSFLISVWESCLRSVPLSPGLSGSCSDTALLGDWKIKY